MDDDLWIILGMLGLFALLTRYKPQQPLAAIKPRVAVAYEPAVKIVNEETWKWTDYKGRKRSLTIHRQVKTTG